MAGSFDGEVISDMVQLAEFTSWLRRSSRNDTCILVSQKPDGKPVVSMDRIRKRVGKRVSVTMLSNSVQQSAYKQLGTVNPYNGSIRIFPAGDGWTTDPRLARFVRGDLPVAEFLESVGRAVGLRSRRQRMAFHGRAAEDERASGFVEGFEARRSESKSCRGGVFGAEACGCARAEQTVSDRHGACLSGHRLHDASFP